MGVILEIDKMKDAKIEVQKDGISLQANL